MQAGTPATQLPIEVEVEGVVVAVERVRGISRLIAQARARAQAEAALYARLVEGALRRHLAAELREEEVIARPRAAEEQGVCAARRFVDGLQRYRALLDDRVLAGGDGEVAPADLWIGDEVLLPAGADIDVASRPGQPHRALQRGADPIDVGRSEVGEPVRPWIAGFAGGGEPGTARDALARLARMQLDQPLAEQHAVDHRRGAEHLDRVDLAQRDGQPVQASRTEEVQIHRVSVDHHGPARTLERREAARARLLSEAVDAAGIPVIDEHQDVAETANAGLLPGAGPDHLPSERRALVALSVRAAREERNEQQTGDGRPHSNNAFSQSGVSNARPRPAARKTRRNRSRVNTMR